MAKPFVSHDGADEQGVRAEVWVQVGNGTVTKIENQDDDTKRNVMVVIRSDNSKVSRPITAWLAKSDPTYPAVVEALASGREIQYRVESQRKPTVDRTTPIADLRVDMATAGANTVSIFAGIDGTLGQEAVTDPAEDPGPGGRLRASDRGAARAGAQQPQRSEAAPTALGVEAALSGLTTARQAGLPSGVVDAAAALALAAGATARQVADAGFTGQSTAPRGEPRRAFAHEAAPHLPLNSDQRVNLGSYAVQAAFSAENVAHDVLVEAEQRAFEAHNAAVAAGELDGEPLPHPRPVAPAQATGLAGVLLVLADRVQVGAYGGGRPDRMANSHTRARSLVYDAVRTRHPVPFGVEAAERGAWMAAVVGEGVERFRALAALSQQVPDVPAPTGGDDGDGTGGDGTGGGGTGGGAGEGAGRSRAQGPEVPAARAEGSAGFVAPTQQAMQRYRDLALAAGFPATPDSPALTFLRVKFGVGVVRQVHGGTLESLLTWFEGQRQPGEAFRSYVESTIAAAQHGTRGEQRPGVSREHREPREPRGTREEAAPVQAPAAHEDGPGTAGAAAGPSSTAGEDGAKGADGGNRAKGADGGNRAKGADGGNRAKGEDGAHAA
ncbi:hypothetical protein [Kineococcus indalonis]|uniref:hypothetical protein n=1 Tax=Kineococcus indalonis TaxID=2696566 RepID=UPI0014120105|nr:hypothetical protein [Kineococcus indalonis]NAZ85273.1 hypothetical protein [Kineococcus indalonis]